jgi:hypothetical protein
VVNLTETDALNQRDTCSTETKYSVLPNEVIEEADKELMSKKIANKKVKH